MTEEQMEAEGKKAPPEIVGEGKNSEPQPSLSPLETILQAHPDVAVGRGAVCDVGIMHFLQNGDRRNIEVSVSSGKNASDRLYPDVNLSGVYESSHFDQDQLIRQHIDGLRTYVTIHIEPDEQVRAEVDYSSKYRPIPEDLQPYAIPIPAFEMVTIAKTGLEMLVAYIGAPEEEKMKVRNSYGRHGYPQVEDGIKSNLDTYIAEASPLLAEGMQRAGISYANAGTKAFFALNALKKVTQGMLPQEPPKGEPPRQLPAR